jgi:hypothetical protein
VGEERFIYGFDGNRKGKRPLGRPWRRWEDNINKGIHALGHEGMDFTELAQDWDR